MTTPEQAALTLILPLAPSTNGLFRNAGKRRIRTGAYDAWAMRAMVELSHQNRAPVPGRVAITIALPLKCPGDIDNRAKATLDFLVNRGLIEDDSMVDDLHIRRSLAGDAKHMVVGVRGL